MAAPRQAAPKKSGSAASKGAAARAERNGASPTLRWRGLTFKLPAKLPGTLVFDLAALERDNESVAPMVQLLDSLLGGESHRVRDKIAEDDIPFDEVDQVLTGLIEDVFGLYGQSVGESPASPRS